MMRRLDEARTAVHSAEDPDERAFLRVALKTAWLDVRAGAHGDDFDYLTFIDVMSALYKKRVLLSDLLTGNAGKHQWWPDDE